MRSTTTTLAGVTIVASVLLAGCGIAQQTAGSATGLQPSARSQATTGTANGTALAPAPAQPAPLVPAKCVAKDVKIVLSDFGEGSGDAAADLVVTNTSTHTCTIYGYGGLALFTGGDGKALPTNLTREATPGPTTVSLRPGGTARKHLRWSDRAAPDEDQDGFCEPLVGFIGVILPDDTVSTDVDAEHPVNSPGADNGIGAVCADGLVHGSAYQPG